MQIAERGTGDVDLDTAPLRDVENYIAPRLRGFVEAGVALLAIKNRRLYLQGGWDTFEIYCRDRWQIEERHARRMIDAAQVAQLAATSATGPMGPKVEVQNERQARELAPLLNRPDELQAVWRETVDRTGGLVTPAAIRNVRRDRERRAAAPETSQPLLPRPPAPEPAVPPEVHRVFLVITQAAQEARSLGAPDVFRGLPVAADVRGIWADRFEDAAALCAELAQACRGAGVD